MLASIHMSSLAGRSSRLTLYLLTRAYMVSSSAVASFRAWKSRSRFADPVRNWRTQSWTFRELWRGPPVFACTCASWDGSVLCCPDVRSADIAASLPQHGSSLTIADSLSSEAYSKASSIGYARTSIFFRQLLHIALLNLSLDLSNAFVPSPHAPILPIVKLRTPPPLHTT